jgi:hypothetical protein
MIAGCFGNASGEFFVKSGMHAADIAHDPFGGTDLGDVAR